MIHFDYRLSQRWNVQLPHTDLKSADLAALLYELFLGDVFVEVDGLDLSAPWAWVPVLDFSVSMRRVVENLSPGEEGTFEFTESEAKIGFKRRDDVVEVNSN